MAGTRKDFRLAALLLKQMFEDDEERYKAARVFSAFFQKVSVTFDPPRFYREAGVLHIHV